MTGLFSAIVIFISFVFFSSATHVALAEAIQLPIKTGYYVPKEYAFVCKLSPEVFSIREEVLLFDGDDNTMSDNEGICRAKKIKNIQNNNNVKSYQIGWECDGLGEKYYQSMIVLIHNTSSIAINERNYIRCNDD